MKRREFISLLGGAAAASSLVWPISAPAQQAAMPVIGFLNGGAPEASTADQAAAFQKGLAETGFVEGRNVTVAYRWAYNDRGRLQQLAADLIRGRVAVIATPGSNVAARAAKAMTTAIPIIFGTGEDPVKLGLVTSLNRPGGNVTGFNSMNGELAGKEIEILRQLLPNAARIAVLANPDNLNSETLVTDTRKAASELGLQIKILTATNNAEIDTAFASVTDQPFDAIVIGVNNLFRNRRVQLATLAAHYRIPTISTDRENVIAGGLMSYGSSVTEQARQVGIYTGRVLKGEKPGDLPVMRATKFEFVINLHSARLLGLNVPTTIRALADEVIE
jgi:putative ABC transport system substrate-binding protein